MWREFGGREAYYKAPRRDAEEQRIVWAAERQAEYDENKKNQADAPKTPQVPRR